MVPLFRMNIFCIILLQGLVIPLPGTLGLTSSKALGRGNEEKLRLKKRSLVRSKAKNEIEKKDRRTVFKGGTLPSKDPMIIDFLEDDTPIGNVEGEGTSSQKNFLSEDPLMDDFVEDDNSGLDEVPVDAVGNPLDDADLEGVHENAALSLDYPNDANNPLDKFEPAVAGGGDAAAGDDDDGVGSIESVEGRKNADYKKDDGTHPGDPGTLDNITLGESDLDGVHENADLSKDLPEDAEDPLDKYDPNEDIPDGATSPPEAESSEETEAEDDNDNSDDDDGKLGPIIVDQHVKANTNQTPEGGGETSDSANDDADNSVDAADSQKAGSNNDDTEAGTESGKKIIVDKHVDTNADETGEGEGEGEGEGDGEGEDEGEGVSAGTGEKIITDKHVDPNADDTESTRNDSGRSGEGRDAVNNVEGKKDQADDDDDDDDITAPAEDEGTGGGNVTSANKTTAENETGAEKKGITFPGCVTRDDQRIREASWRKTVAKPGSLCVFGLDDREEGHHCIFEADFRFGSFGWCWTRADKSEWGSCGQGCPLFGQAEILGDKIDELHDIVAKALGMDPDADTVGNDINTTTANAATAANATTTATAMIVPGRSGLKSKLASPTNSSPTSSRPLLDTAYY